MDNDPEVTLEQMQETRTALSEKLETLGQQVADTVHGATSAVTETVETVKDAVHETVGTVKDTLNIPLQVHRHPWGMVGGSIALGYLGGYLLARNRSGRSRVNALSRAAAPEGPRLNNQPSDVVREERSVKEAPRKQTVHAESSGPADHGMLSAVTNQFGPELTKLKGLAIGTLLSLVRDLITQSASEPMKAGLADVLDSLTVKLGGEPVRGPVLKESAEDLEEHNTLEMARPFGAVQRRFSQ